MHDVSFMLGGDLILGPTGDLALVDGLTLSKQRIIRRLLTNPGGYIWHLDYGAGLPSMIGQPTYAASIEAIVRAQIALEASVAATPEPIVSVSSTADGYVYVTITYTVAGSGQQNTFSLSVT